MHPHGRYIRPAQETPYFAPSRVYESSLNPRLGPGLTMSRSLGDVDADRCGVIPTPEVAYHTIRKGVDKFIGARAAMLISHRDRSRSQATPRCMPRRSDWVSVIVGGYAHGCLPHSALCCRCLTVLASDGLWEFISSQHAAEIVQGFLARGEDAITAARFLIAKAAVAWRTEEGDYRDDITVVVLYIDALPESLTSA